MRVLVNWCSVIHAVHNQVELPAASVHVSVKQLWLGGRQRQLEVSSSRSCLAAVALLSSMQLSPATALPPQPQLRGACFLPHLWPGTASPPPA